MRSKIFKLNQKNWIKNNLMSFNQIQDIFQFMPSSKIKEKDICQGAQYSNQASMSWKLLYHDIYSVQAFKQLISYLDQVNHSYKFSAKIYLI